MRYNVVYINDYFLDAFNTITEVRERNYPIIYFKNNYPMKLKIYWEHNERELLRRLRKELGI